jgi:phage portal protein BeeE
VRLLDRLSRRYMGGPGEGLWGGVGEASGAAILTTTYGSNGNEPILPQLVSTSMQAYGSNAVVFGALLARLMLFSEAEFKFRRLRDKSLYGSPALLPLEQPWPNGTTGELLARMIQDVDLAGNAYVWNATEQLVRLRPDWVTIISELVQDVMGRPYRKVVGYFFDPPPTANQGDPQIFLVDEVAHWSPIPDPWATFRGMSWLTPVLREVSADNAMTAYKIKYLQNAASPNLLVKYSQKLGADTAERLQDRITARHGGVDNAFRTLVLDEGADATVIGNTFEQMNFSTVQAAGENRIIIASGVPGIVIGSKEGLMAATYSNYEQAMRRFADLTMRPLWRSVSSCLSSLITVPSDSRLWFDTTDIAALRQGEKEMADTMLVKMQGIVAAVQGGFDPDSAVAAMASGSVDQLTHTGPALPAAPPSIKLAGPPPAVGGKAGVA